ncbi:MAG: tetratricopeptide repeat protein, partial [Duganella sp.]
MEAVFLQRLGLAPDADERAIRRAYARALKRIDQEHDLQGFQQLREDYEAALQWLRHAGMQEDAQQYEDQGATGQPASTPPPAPAMPAAPETAETTATSSAGAAAHAVFSTFVQHPPAQDAAAWRRALEHCLDDPQLVSIAAREQFEQHLAQWLADGWRPGHETLLEAAIATFGWDSDRRRLQSLGHGGALVDTAIDEYTMFELQAAAELKAQRKLLQRLRDARAPGARELVRHAPTLEVMVARFPRWLTMVASVEQIIAWRQQHAELAPWRRRLAQLGQPGQRRPPEHTAKAARGGMHWGTGWIIFLLAVTLLRAVAQWSGGTEAPPEKAAAAQASGHTQRGATLFDAGQHAEALAAYNAADTLVPGQYNTLTGRARAYLELKQYEAALRDLDKVLQRQPDDGYAQWLRAHILNLQDKPELAQAQLERLVSSDADNDGAHLALVEFHLNHRQYPQAMSALDHAIKVLPKPSAYLLSLRALLNLRQGPGQLARAEADFSAALNASTTPPQLNETAWMLATNNVALPHALKFADLALASAPKPAYMDTRGLILLRLGRYAEAAEQYGAAMAMQPDYYHAMYGRGLARRKLGQRSAGDADLQAAR